MAVVNMLCWNIEVYGPNKYGNVPNNMRIVSLIAQVAAAQNANVFLLMELMSSVATQICFSVAQEITNVTGNPWSYVTLPARPNGDRESYGVLWQTNANFNVVTMGNGAQAVDLSSLDFPNNFSNTNGRRAAVGVFRTTDTNNNFAVTVYHAPPNARATVGLEVLAKTPEIYSVNNGGAVQNVGRRFLGGDYNLDVNVQPEYTWLTNAVPAVPPPAAPGQGAGTTAVTAANTHLTDMYTAVQTWGNQLNFWPNTSASYRDLQLDNIFVTTGLVGAGGQVVNLVASIMNVGSPIRAIAQAFVLLDPNTLNPAFPYAFSVPQPLNINLSLASCAWMLYRYGISDHLPMFATATV